MLQPHAPKTSLDFEHGFPAGACTQSTGIQLISITCLTTKAMDGQHNGHADAKKNDLVYSFLQLIVGIVYIYIYINGYVYK